LGRTCPAQRRPARSPQQGYTQLAPNEWTHSPARASAHAVRLSSGQTRADRGMSGHGGSAGVTVLLVELTGAAPNRRRTQLPPRPCVGGWRHRGRAALGSSPTRGRALCWTSSKASVTCLPVGRRAPSQASALSTSGLSRVESPSRGSVRLAPSCSVTQIPLVHAAL